MMMDWLYSKYLVLLMACIVIYVDMLPLDKKLVYLGEHSSDGKTMERFRHCAVIDSIIGTKEYADWLDNKYNSDDSDTWFRYISTLPIMP